MIVTNDERIAERAKSLRNLCFPKEKRIYLPSSSGLKGREIRYICDAIQDIGKRR